MSEKRHVVKGEWRNLFDVTVTTERSCCFFIMSNVNVADISMVVTWTRKPEYTMISLSTP